MSIRRFQASAGSNVLRGRKGNVAVLYSGASVLVGSAPNFLLALLCQAVPDPRNVPPARSSTSKKWRGEGQLKVPKAACGETSVSAPPLSGAIIESATAPSQPRTHISPSRPRVQLPAARRYNLLMPQCLVGIRRRKIPRSGESE